MKSSMLGRLAPELRHKIYEHAFDDEIVRVGDEPDGEATLPPLLCTCTQIHSEAELVLYERARLVIEILDHYVENAISWLEQLEPEQAEAITSLTIKAMIPSVFTLEREHHQNPYIRLLHTVQEVGIRDSAFRLEVVDNGASETKTWLVRNALAYYLSEVKDEMSSVPVGQGSRMLILNICGTLMSKETNIESRRTSL